MIGLLCDNLEQAKANRERVKQGIGNEFYDQQARAVAQWRWGELAPNTVILGELPTISANSIQLDR